MAAQDRKWAASFLKGLEAARKKATSDPRAHGDYWNGDSWGSISGIRDAEKWVNDQLVNYVLRRARSKP